MRLFVLVLIFVACSYSQIDDGFLSNWIGTILPALPADVTPLDLSVPGTHDTMTYDLSLIVSEGDAGGNEALSIVLHYASELGVTPSEWIRNQSRTQGLNITQQLNNGVRFLDFRMMYTSDDWYSLHFMQSQHKVIEYMTEIRTWLDQHPQEILVMWLSKHGSACARGNDQYPDVPISVKQAFWKVILEIFSGVVVNVKQTPINTTSVRTLISQNTRVIFYATDYVQFTDNSPYALDGCLVDNQLCSGIDHGMSSITCSVQNFKNATSIRKSDKQNSKFFLHSMATSGGGNELIYQFLIKYADIDDKVLHEQCSKLFSGIPGITGWCPVQLLDISQLQNYYNQVIFENAIQNQYMFPNAIYLDAFDIDGTIRAGTQVYKKRNSEAHEVVRYAYAYSVILSNLVSLCGAQPSAQCAELITRVKQLRSAYPMQRWDDPSTGRSSTWPF